jgi:TRAP-type C4-dicarboxylate transport system substrate-binding protein
VRSRLFITFSVLLIATMLALAAGCGTGTPAAAGPIKWKAQSGLSPTSYQGLYQFKVFADVIKQESNGRLVVDILAPGALVDAYGQFAALQKGVIDVSMGVGGYNISAVPEGDIEQGLPGTFANEDDFYDCYMNYKGGQFHNILVEAYKEKGAYLLKSPGPSPTAIISRQPFRTVADMAGKKIRASGANVDLVKNLNATPVTLATAEVYMALQTGTVDAVMFPTYTIGTMTLWTACKGITLPSVGQTSGDILVSQKAWDALPADLKDIVDRAAITAADSYMGAVKAQTKIMLDQATSQYKVEIVNLTGAEFDKLRAAAKPIIDKAATATPRSAQLVNIIREYLAAKSGK